MKSEVSTRIVIALVGWKVTYIWDWQKYWHENFVLKDGQDLFLWEKT